MKRHKSKRRERHSYNEVVPMEIDRKRFHVNDLRSVRPITDTQTAVFRSHSNDQNMVLHGAAGTGKTFLSIYLGLSEVLDPDSDYEKMIVVRSNVPTRELGHLPGELDEKMAVFEDPYIQICDELFNYKRAYENLKRSGYLNFISTSYLRGLTFRRSVVVVDESENLNYHELASIMTRIGKGSKIVFSGDTRQTDLLRSRRDRSGLHELIRTVKLMPSFDTHEFIINDIVRSGVVREFILAEHKLEMAAPAYA